MNDHSIKPVSFVFVALAMLSSCAGPTETVKRPEAVTGQEASEPAKITDITAEALEGKVRVTIESARNLSYTTFMLTDPARLILDLPNTVVNEKGPIPVNKGAVIQIVPSQLPNENKTSSIEIQLSKLVRYQAFTDKNKLYVDIQDGREGVAGKPQGGAPAQGVPLQGKPSTGEAMPPESAPGKTKPQAPIPPAKASVPELKPSTITEVAIAQQPKETRVIIKADKLPEYEVKKESQPPRVIVSLKKSDIAPEAQKIVEVRLIPSAIKRVTSFQLKRTPGGAENLVQVIIHLTQALDPRIITAEGALIVAIPHPTQLGEVPEPTKSEEEKGEEAGIPLSELTVAPAPSLRASRVAEEAKYRGQLVTLDFKDADVRDVLRILAEIQNFNLVLHPEVSGRVTVRLIDVPWDQALDTILKLHNLAVEIEGNVLRVGSRATFQREIEAKRLEQEQRFLAMEAQKKLEPLRTEMIPLNFADPSQVVTIVEGVMAGRRGGR